MSRYDIGDREQRVTITEDVAERIYRLLVAYADADPTQRTHFVQSMAETGLGRDQEEWELKSGYYGVTHLSLCGDEWIVRTSQDDISPRTIEQVNTTNLELAKLRDTVDAEQNP